MTALISIVVLFYLVWRFMGQISFELFPFLFMFCFFLHFFKMNESFLDQNLENTPKKKNKNEISRPTSANVDPISNNLNSKIQREELRKTVKTFSYLSLHENCS